MADDTFQVTLNAEEKKIIGVKEPKADKVETKGTDKVDETIKDKNDKSEVKADKVEEVKADEKVEKVIDGKISKAFGLKKEGEVTEEVKPVQELTISEREEFLKLKTEDMTKKEKEAFAEVMKDYTDEEISILNDTVVSIISSEIHDKWLDNGMSPEQRALLITAMAEKEHRTKLQEIRSKELTAKLKEVEEKVKANEKARTEIKEIAQVEVTNATDTTPQQKSKEIHKKAKAGDRDALKSMIMGDSTEEKFLKSLNR